MAADLPQYGTGERPEPDSITFAGNGEPTLHPGFRSVVDVAARLRDKWLPDAPLNLFTDGMHLVDAGVRAATGQFRRVFLKLDGASEAVVEKINGPGAWRGICRALAIGRQLPNVAASTVLVTGSDANTNDVKSGRFVDLVSELQPRELYLYTLDYPNPGFSVAAIDFETLIDCAEWLAERVTSPVIALWRLHKHRTIVI
jgi:wyosine [tRNA(Phe)-imidazoG37] synthetase (radical SAM superfamily)